MNIGPIILILLHVIILVSQLIVNPTHLSDPTWPIHAKDHLVRAIYFMAGLNLVAMLIAYYPLRKGERWAWWALAIAGLALIGGTLGSGIISHEPLPSDVMINFSILAFIDIVGLALSWKFIKK